MSIVIRSFSLPADMAEELDKVAADNLFNRSQTLVRIFREWQQLKAGRLTLPLISPLHITPNNKTSQAELINE